MPDLQDVLQDELQELYRARADMRSMLNHLLAEFERRAAEAESARCGSGLNVSAAWYHQGERDAYRRAWLSLEAVVEAHYG